MTNQEKESEELKGICKAIRKWMDKYGGEVQFIGSFVAFKDVDSKDCEVIDDLIIGYGAKKTIQMSLDDLNEMLGKEKEDFINW